MRALHAEQRPRRTTQETSGMFSPAATVWPHAGQRERGTKRLNLSAGAMASPRKSAHSYRQPRSIIFGKRWMTTFRNEPTTSPNTRRSHGNTVGWAAALRMSLIGPSKKGYGLAVTLSNRCAMELMLDRLADLEDRQVHRDHHAADQHAEHHHDHRFHQTGERVDRIVDLRLEEVCDFAEHGIERAGFFPDRHHLHDHVGKDVGFLHRGGQARPRAYLPLDFLGGHRVDVIPRSAADRFERLDQGHARREHDGERPGPARNGGDRKSVVEGKSVDLGGPRIIKKKR